MLDVTANFSGDGYLQLDAGLLDKTSEKHSIAMTFTTNSANGLLYWQGQEPNSEGVVENYIAISGITRLGRPTRNGPSVRVINVPVKIVLETVCSKSFNGSKDKCPGQKSKNVIVLKSHEC